MTILRSALVITTLCFTGISAAKPYPPPSPLSWLIGAAVRGGGKERRPLAGDAEMMEMADFLDSSPETHRDHAHARDADDVKLYPAMTRKQISAALKGVTLYCITRASDGGVLLAKADSMGGERSAVYFFLDRQTAEANLNKVREGGNSSNVELRVSTASLGKIWERFFLPNDGGSASEGNGAVEYRLIPDAQELLKARFLLTVTEKDMEKGLTAEAGKRLVRKVNANPSKFKGGYNEIPLFVVPQMRLLGRRRYQLLRPFKRRRECLPVYFSLEDMSDAVRQIPAFANENPAISVMDLRELLGQMGQDSVNLDLRDVVFVPSGAGQRGTDSASRMTAVEANDGDPKGGCGDASADVSRTPPTTGGVDDMPAVGSWLRPRRRIRDQDYEALFGQDA